MSIRLVNYNSSVALIPGYVRWKKDTNSPINETQSRVAQRMRQTRHSPHQFWGEKVQSKKMCSKSKLTKLIKITIMQFTNGSKLMIFRGRNPPPPPPIFPTSTPPKQILWTFLAAPLFSWLRRAWQSWQYWALPVQILVILFQFSLFWCFITQFYTFHHFQLFSWFLVIMPGTSMNLMNLIMHNVVFSVLVSFKMISVHFMISLSNIWCLTLDTSWNINKPYLLLFITRQPLCILQRQKQAWLLDVRGLVWDSWYTTQEE